MSRRAALSDIQMSENEKPESGFVNLPSPDRENPASRGATSQDDVSGTKVTADGKSAKDEKEPKKSATFGGRLLVLFWGLKYSHVLGVQNNIYTC